MFSLLNLTLSVLLVAFVSLFILQRTYIGSMLREKREREKEDKKRADEEYERSRVRSYAKADSERDAREKLDRLIASERRVAVLEAKPHAKAAGFLQEVFAENNTAKKKFPESVGSLAALTEEVGELAKALMEEPSARVRAEAVQVASMAMRIALEGDPSLDSMRDARGADAHPLPESANG